MWQDILNALEIGEVRSAQKQGDRWIANAEVKQEILNAFKAGKLVEQNGFVDKHNLMPQVFTTEKNVRFVPGGSSVRKGSYIAPGVIIMPPSYINVGAYVDEGTMVDSHVLIGSCAQIGKRVHLSAGVQIGGVLEPIGQTPVVIEDDAFIGAGCIIVEGILVKSKAVLAPGVILSRGIPVFDCVNNRILDRGEPIPERAVVVSGTRPFNKTNTWANEMGLQMRCALIVKYRDSDSDTSLELESILR
jgi:2,3,4,5-tetrahydropyridine-2-carboxylate N-succinyltransferase